MQVDLTDVEGPVLRNLRDCMHLNASSSATDASSDAAHKKATGISPAAANERVLLPPSDAQLFDDAESVDGEDEDLDLGALMLREGEGCQGNRSDKGREQGSKGAVISGKESVACGGIGMNESKGGGQQLGWQAGNMHVRLLDWLESLQQLERAGQQKQQKGVTEQQQQQGSSTEQPHHQGQQGGGTADHSPIDPSKFYAKDLLRTGEGSPQGTHACTHTLTHKLSHAHTHKMLVLFVCMAACNGMLLLSLLTLFVRAGDVPPSIPAHAQYQRIIGTDVSQFILPRSYASFIRSTALLDQQRHRAVLPLLVFRLCEPIQYHLHITMKCVQVMYEPMHAELVAAVLAHR